VKETQTEPRTGPCSRLAGDQGLAIGGSSNLCGDLLCGDSAAPHRIAPRREALGSRAW
jgi:hypothetical protein